MSGRLSVTANLATPELVQTGENFFLTFDGADPSDLPCGAALEYTIAPGTSLHGADQQTNDAGGSPTGQ